MISELFFQNEFTLDAEVPQYMLIFCGALPESFRRQC